MHFIEWGNRLCWCIFLHLFLRGMADLLHALQRNAPQEQQTLIVISQIHTLILIWRECQLVLGNRWQSRCASSSSRWRILRIPNGHLLEVSSILRVQNRVYGWLQTGSYWFSVRNCLFFGNIASTYLMFSATFSFFQTFGHLNDLDT